MMMYSFRPVFRTVRSLAMITAVVGMASLAVLTAHADTLITAGADKKVKLWNPVDGTLIKSIDASDGVINALIPSFDGKYLASGGADKKIKVWNAADGTLVTTINDAHDGAVTTLMFSPDSKKLYSGGADKKVKSWDPATGKSLASFSAHEGALVGVFALPEMTITGGADGAVKIWDGENNVQMEIPTQHEGGLTAMTGSATQQMLFTGGADGKLKFWSQEGTGVFDGAQGGAIKAILVIGKGDKILTGGANGKVGVWDTATHKLLKTIDDVSKDGVNGLSASPDGKSIYTAGADGKVKVWDADGKLVKTIDAADGAVTVVFYLPSAPAKTDADKKPADAKEAPKP